MKNSLNQNILIYILKLDRLNQQESSQRYTDGEENKRLENTGKLTQKQAVNQGVKWNLPRLALRMISRARNASLSKQTHETLRHEITRCVLPLKTYFTRSTTLNVSLIKQYNNYANLSYNVIRHLMQQLPNYLSCARLTITTC